MSAYTLETQISMSSTIVSHLVEESSQVVSKLSLILAHQVAAYEPETDSCTRFARNTTYQAQEVPENAFNDTQRQCHLS
jgi:hypothetical protein